MPTADDIRWFKQQFRTQIEGVLAGTPFDLDMIVAIACQETGSIWSVLRKVPLPLDQILALCVGDTIDYQGPGKGRQAFPRNKAALVAETDGQQMFDIARKALEDMAVHVPGYSGVVQNPDKFCHGFGVFQRDLQFFRQDPGYFLNQNYQVFSHTLDHCLLELRRGLKTRGYEAKTSLTDFEFATVAIAYNRGSYNTKKGLKQGYFDGSKYYGEWIFDYVQLSRTVDGAAAAGAGPGRYAVVARDGLRLRGGPGTDFPYSRTLPLGTELTVVSVDPGNPDWVRVDLEGDGLLDGYVFAAFLAAATGPHGGEDVPEPE
ncbi:SH3 domain-containing protein [Mycobacterium sp. KBS0706]|uniref:SH3 domain-containing protein n=1 Tax=Mycobacterium sp. KBS0706 TaxID=2578109 RepID=UPI00110FE1F8|nr:SH3 domain-containing protein [Mycobacterium sp. KBS0706]TSD88346.1 SH3 domain-containing protein [Mycobacterium sp. KBS0706]